MDTTYERNIGLKTIWQTILRRWKIILIIFIPIALGSVVVTQFMLKSTYQSSVSLINNAALNTTQHSNIQNQIKKAETLDTTVANLAAKESPIVITSNDILSGLTVTAFNSSEPGFVKFSFKSTNQAIVQPVLEELSNVALEQIKANGFANMSISSPASNASNISKNKTYLLIGVAAGFVLGCGLAFVDEIISDEVYDKEDVEMLGSPSFELTVSK